jgi:hypothetical protein
MKPFLLIALLYLPIISYGQAPCSEEWEKLLKTDFKIYTKRGSIPNELSDFIKNQVKGKFKMANPKKGYNSTDVKKPLRKDRRLIFVANQANHWVIVYEKGGRGHSIVCALADLEVGDVKSFCSFSAPRLASFEDLRNSFSLSNWRRLDASLL